jgi:CDP-4-dehydro-6-deoxyglucose reductase, E3
MSQMLNLARAAHLVGVPRGALQRMIGAGEIEALDGLIAIEELRRVFPAAAIDDSGAFERVRTIREEAFGRRLRERVLPSSEVLAQRLFVQSQELADLRRYLHAYHDLVVATSQRIETLAASDVRLRPLREFVYAELKRVLGGEPAEALDAMANLMQVISAHVTVRPSGRQFLVEGNDSILQAGLKAGLRLGYGCGTGNCGLCKARVVSGEVRRIQHSDLRLTEAERQQGYLLLCSHTAVTDLVIESLEASGPADIPQQDLVATVRAVTDLGPRTRLLHLQSPRSSRLRFLSGQLATLGVAGVGDDIEQTVALASCPCDERNLQFHLSRADEGPLTTALFDGHIRVGQSVSVRGPVGDFVLEAESARPLVFAACDTGFGPIKSLIEHAMASEQVDSFALYWLASHEGGHYLDNLCRTWVAAYDQFVYEREVDADPVAGAHRLTERAAARTGLSESEIFIAGPPTFVFEATAAFIAAGAPLERTHTLVV